MRGDGANGVRDTKEWGDREELGSTGSPKGWMLLSSGLLWPCASRCARSLLLSEALNPDWHVTSQPFQLK